MKILTFFPTTCLEKNYNKERKGANKNTPKVKFKEFEMRLKYETRFKHGWFHMRVESAQFEPIFGGSATQFKFFEFGLCSIYSPI